MNEEKILKLLTKGNIEDIGVGLSLLIYQHKQIVPFFERCGTKNISAGDTNLTKNTIGTDIQRSKDWVLYRHESMIFAVRNNIFVYDISDKGWTDYNTYSYEIIDL